MISKTKLKELAAYRQQKVQDAEGVFVVEGAKMAAEALATGAEVLYTCATSEWKVESGKWSVGEFYEVTQAELERLSLMRAPQQVWMVVRRSAECGVRSSELEVGTQNSALSTQHSELILSLDRIQDPGNMGTIMRTADWYGVRRIVCSRDTVSCYNPKVVQASMGAVFRTRVEYVDLPQWLSTCGMEVIGASLDGEPISGKWKVEGGKPVVLLIGNEGRGISEEAMRQVTRRATIPNRGGTAESLNAAVAAAILMDRIVGGN